MIDPDRWVRLLFQLHERHTEDDADLTFAERRAALDFGEVHDRFVNGTRRPPGWTPTARWVFHGREPADEP